MPIELELKVNDETVKTESIDYGEEKDFVIDGNEFAEGENDLGLYFDEVLDATTELVKEVAKYEVDISEEQSSDVVGQGNEVSIFAGVHNSGNDVGDEDINLKFADEGEVDAENVVLAPGNSEGVWLHYELADDYDPGEKTAIVSSIYDSDEISIEVERAGFVPFLYEAGTTYRIEQGDIFDVAVDVVNQHHEEDAQVIELQLDGEIVDTAAASLDKGEEERVDLFHSTADDIEIGTHEVTVKTERHETSFDLKVKEEITEVSVTFNTNYEDVDVTVEGVTETTDENGVAVFEDLVKDSEYDYEIEGEDILDKTGSFVADADKTIDIDLDPALVDVTFAAGEGRQGIEITIDEETETTDENGEAVFTDIANQEEHIYHVVSESHEDIEDTFTAEIDKTIDISDDLVEIWVDVTVSVGVEDATVIVNEESLGTGVEGEVTFENLENGIEYDYEVIHENYYDESGSFVAEEDKLVEIELRKTARTVIKGIDNLEREPLLERHVIEDNIIELNEVPDTDKTIKVYKLEENND